MTMKRLFDLVVTSIGIVLTAPLMIMIAIAIKLESRGPIYYRCVRVGQHGRLFNMLKFRTMLETADKIDCKVCCKSDVRVTPFGNFLRRTKLNELPQLFNVISGEMSLVGPRPEDPKFIDNHKDKWQIVLTVKPGIVGPNQIRQRNEEDLFDTTQDPESFYLEKLLSQKLDLDIQYVRTNSFWSDMSILATGWYVTIFGSGIVLQTFKDTDRLARMLEDAALSVCAYLLAHFFRFETIVWDNSVWPNLLIVVAVNPILFASLGLYQRSTRFFSTPDIFSLAKVIVLSCLVLMAGNKLFLSWQGHSRTVFLCYPLILMCLMSAVRILRRLLFERKEIKSGRHVLTRNALIYGAGRIGVETARCLFFQPGLKVIGFLDDDPKMNTQTILGLKVLGTGSDLPLLKRLYDIEEIFVAFRSPTREELSKVRRRCSEVGLTEIICRSSITEARFMPFVLSNNFRSLRLSDLLGMKEILLNTAQLKTYFQGATVAIDGAGDHLGEHICRELLNLEVGKLIIVETCPARLYRLNRFVNSLGYHQPRIYSYLVPTGSQELLEKILREQDPAYLICNGSSRPVPDSSLNWPALFLTNFIQIVRKVRLARRVGCRCFSFLSPYLKDSLSIQEKAVNLLSEHYVKLCGSEQVRPGTRTGVIRLPNVLDDESDILRDGLLGQKGNPSSKDSQRLVRFTSARYAARIVLNIQPLHQNGEIFVENASQAYRIGEFAEFYFETLAKGNQLGVWKSSPRLKPFEPSAGEQEFQTGYNETPLSYVLVDENPEMPDIDTLEFLTEFNADCLTTADRMVIKEFISYLNEYSGAHPNYGPAKEAYHDRFFPQCQR